MSWTKGQIVDEAMIELALAGYVFDTQPEERQALLRRLDMMMALWDSKGISVGYNLTADPTAVDQADPTGLPLSVVEPVYTNLAIRACAMFGKQVPASLAKTAKEGYDALMTIAGFPREQQFRSGVVAGAGNKPSRTGRQFLPEPDTSPLQNTEGGDLDFLEP